jgi:hypothetical protein
VPDFLAHHPEYNYIDPINRLKNNCSEVSGDLILIAKGKQGFYFGSPTKGVHGGLLPGESDPVLTFALPNADLNQLNEMREIIQGTITAKTINENNRKPSIVDMVPAILEFECNSNENEGDC